MRDFLPADKAQRERVLGVIRNTFRSHGFDEIETPVMEDSNRLHAGLGGDNEKLAFAVMKRALTTDDLRAAEQPLDLADLGLRFDLTVPLARFYASHRGELPTVFRSIQIGAVWRAERPQKGRYRQFMQCDIDIIGEAGPIAEVELITATVATIDALGLDGCSIRINDRRLLTSALTLLGFPPKEHEPVLVTIDKLDKIGHDGVITELRDRGFPAGPVDALDDFFTRPMTTQATTPATTQLTTQAPAQLTTQAPPFGEAVIRRLLPEGVDPVAVTELAAIGVAATRVVGRDVVQFDPWLVRGMGYYTGTIFEVAHPSLSYSLGGGGRYDGMIGRFLGSDVPAVGFSLGFERLVELVELEGPEGADSVALIHDPAMSPTALLTLKAAIVADGRRVRVERRPKNVKPLLDQLVAAGFGSYAFVDESTVTPEFRQLG